MIAGARALLNTSVAEGFPNAFLEAWALGTPVISLFVDPANLIRTHRLGYVCDGNMDMLLDLLQREKYDLPFDEIKQYVLQHYSSENAIQTLVSILDPIKDGQGHE